MIDTQQFFWTILWGTLKTLIAFWPLWVILGILIIIKLFFEQWLPDWINNLLRLRKIRRGEKWHRDRELLRWLRGMRPDEFEKYIADLFARLGYRTRATGGPYDQGIDVIAEKNGVEHYIQCKKFITSEVHVGNVRDFYGAIADHLAQGRGFFITTNKFTLEAEKFAEDKPIELIDGYRLLEYVHLANKAVPEPTSTLVDEKCPSLRGTTCRTIRGIW